MEKNNRLLQLFEHYARNESSYTAFAELIDLFLIPFKIYPSERERSDALQALTLNERRGLMLKVFMEIGNVSMNFTDAIGDLFMQTIANGRNGQVFTPHHITDLMAAITVRNSEANQTVFDPACGSGRMLLSAARINRHLQLFGADIDLICCKMTVMNMLLNSLVSEIVQMDTLTNNFYRGFKTGITLHNGFYLPWYTEFTDARESLIWSNIIINK